ncbi:MAG: hypothetical protein EOO38_12555 [Cytophagaceae bacterium]|nr:MAG: hypothetical protein EOO38_12555 [Cytophagaceae bacterium]
MAGFFPHPQLGPASLALEAMMMSDCNPRNRRWSDDDVAALRAMAASGKSLTPITAKLKRPIKTIKSHAQDLGIHLPGTEIGMRTKR